MRRVFISVEGQTEETFVRRVLRAHLEPHGLWLVPVIVKTRRMPGGPDYRGGHITYARIRREIQMLLSDSSAVAVTTMYDLYALPKDAPGLSQVQAGSLWERVAWIEDALGRDVANHRFRPYVQVHEFEALLFAGVAQTVAALRGTDRQRNALHRIAAAFASPEEIDDDPNTTPSRRLKALFPGYEKVLHGPTIAAEIGLDVLRAQCPHFGAWLGWLESL